MIRILHVIGGMDRAGAETMVMNVYRNIDRTRIQFDFIYFKAKACDYDEEILSLGGKIFRIVEGNPAKNFLKLVSFFKQHPEYKIVHSHTLLNIAVNLLAARLAKVPVRIAHSHNTQSQLNGSLVYRLYQAASIYIINKVATEFIACGYDAAKFLFRKDTKYTLVHYPINVNEIYSIGLNYRNYIRDQFTIPANVPIYIQVGRLEEQKNYFFTIKLLKHLKETREDFRFFILGRGILEQPIKKKIEESGLADHVIMLGVRSDVLKIMAGADAMLMPSFFEGLPVTLVETQAIGLPALISDAITEEVDLGVSLIHRLSLDEKTEVWADKLLALQREIPHKKNTQVIIDKGYDVQYAAAFFTNLYLKNSIE
ncbi:glycosyltransferase [Emticicia sp. TH156]|uniref:glycosyltransferase n=1 Tax=Emticicia sp. TH156 TaxID=2067454 RepID=UPI000C76C06C|nr:glycosyltransferase [Emticicia sp. TH156]PLK44224.1 glycosyltransferase family 1 protein [Emticicia sp. TH156]